MNATDNDERPSAPRKSKRSPSVITAAEALELLQSAVNYCQATGLAVRAGNVPNLCLSIDGAMMQGDPPRFIVADSLENLPVSDMTADTCSTSGASARESPSSARPVRSPHGTSMGSRL